MRLVPNPEKEAKNLRKHGLDFSHVGKLLGQPFLDEPDDRPLGYEQEGRVRITGRVGARVFVLIGEPGELENGEFALKPISFRDATRAETRQFWRWHG